MKFRMRDDRDISDEPIHQLPTRKRFRDILSNGEDLDKVPGTDGFECTVHKSLGSSQSHKRQLSSQSTTYFVWYSKQDMRRELIPSRDAWKYGIVVVYCNVIHPRSFRVPRRGKFWEFMTLLGRIWVQNHVNGSQNAIAMCHLWMTIYTHFRESRCHLIFLSDISDPNIDTLFIRWHMSLIKWHLAWKKKGMLQTTASQYTIKFNP